MNDVKVRNGDLQAKLRDVLDEFAASETEKIVDITKEVADELVADLKDTSPRRSVSEKHYADGWKLQTEKVRGGGISAVIYNGTKPGLSHLLENGHAKVNGGRVAAIPHIKPAEDKWTQELIKRLEAKL